MFLPSNDHLSRHIGTDLHPGAGESWIGRVTHSVLARLREALHRRAVLRELGALSDRELADIGLTRAELPWVFDPAFIAARRDA